jgi:hypothetical protein
MAEKPPDEQFPRRITATTHQNVSMLPILVDESGEGRTSPPIRPIMKGTRLDQAMHETLTQ